MEGGFTFLIPLREAIIIITILLLLCVVRPSLINNCTGIFNVRNDFNARYADEGESGTATSAQVLTRLI